jgi:predicted amidohydrolase
VHNTLAVLSDGRVAAAYRKVHLYDAFSFVESDTVSPGDGAPPVVEIGGVPVGFATCYDLRFPELFRVLQAGGAQVLAIASAWVRGPLKEEHWMTLLRARAIENVSYVVAADQIGRAGIGRSAAFDPFGLPLLDLGIADPGFATVDVLPERVAEVREMLPAAGHTRFAIDPAPHAVRSPAGEPARTSS